MCVCIRIHDASCFTGLFRVVMYKMMGASDGVDSTIRRLNQAKADFRDKRRTRLGDGQRKTSVVNSLMRCRPVGRIRGDVEKRAMIATTTTTTTTTHLMSKHHRHRESPDLIQTLLPSPQSLLHSPKLYHPSSRCSIQSYRLVIHQTFN
jgi:hypothetical protein